MQDDLQAKLERLLAEAEDCVAIAELAPDDRKQICSKN
jgi:hypothetical protein